MADPYLKPTLILTVGLPRSGKTTWAQSASRVLHAPIVSPDAIRIAMHGQEYYPNAEPLVWAHANLMVRSLFQVGYDYLIFDSCSVTHSRRSAWKSRDWHTRFKVIDTPRDECLRRAELYPDLIPVIERMSENYQPLAGEELEKIFDTRLV